MSEYKVVVTPRISETDLVGHINNASVAVWFEDLRVRYLGDAFSAEPSLPTLPMTVASITINYLRETFFGADVLMTVPKVELGNSSFTLHGAMFQNGHQVIEARAVMVHWSADTHKPQRISDEYRERIIKFQQDD
ncbi:MAG: acyl-CoA thioesterase [Pseudomonadales bacterium]